MLYSKVYIEAFGYELPPNVVTSDDLELRLEPLYKTLHFTKGQLEAITGIRERRFWDPGFNMHTGAVMAGKSAGIIWNLLPPAPFPTVWDWGLKPRYMMFPMPVWVF